jgi:hypothetical protein
LSPLLAAAVNLTTVPTPDQITEILILLTAQSVCEIHELFCIGANQQVPYPFNFSNDSTPTMLHVCNS